MKRLPLLLVLFLLLSSLPLGARTRLANVDTRCPLFGHEFTAQALSGDDEFAAFDSDLCKRPQGSSLYVLSIWTCPYCFFSAYQSEYMKALDPKFRDLELRRYPLDKSPSEIQQSEIFVGIKFHNAERFYREQGRDAWFLYDLMLRGTYACRVTTVEETNALRFLRERWVKKSWTRETRYSAEQVSLALVGSLREELKKKKQSAEDCAMLRYLLADSLRQAGDHLEAAVIFDELQNEAALGAVEAKGVRIQRNLCQKERDFQEKALAYLVEAQGKDIVPESNRALTVYLRGELERRLGKIDEARGSFRRAATMPAEQEWLAALIDKQQERLPAPKSGSKARRKGN